MYCRVLFFLFIIFTSKLYAQEVESISKPYPNSILEFGVGIGANHGMYGFKAVVGSKGSGLLLGIGADQSKYASQLGVQVGYKFFYFSLSYGNYGHYDYLSETELARGVILMSGVKINLNRNKTFYLEIGGGYGYGHRYREGSGRFKDFNRILYNVGIGVRI